MTYLGRRATGGRVALRASNHDWTLMRRGVWQGVASSWVAIPSVPLPPDRRLICRHTCRCGRSYVQLDPTTIRRLNAALVLALGLDQ